jgi:poly-gamma-glutamate capsule biosynthesis protein CapA/YwtB (metallophosphatase superfamily)
VVADGAIFRREAEPLEAEEEDLADSVAEAAVSPEVAAPAEDGNNNCTVKYIIPIFILVSLNAQLHSQQNDTVRLSLVFAGDIMGHDEQITGAWDPAMNAYNYEPAFRYVKPFIEQADIAISNLEVTLAGKPYKGYPQFSSPDELAMAARDAGFDVLIQANNHALDRGQPGFNRTIQMLDSLKIIHTGTFPNEKSRALNYPLILQKNDIRLALLNYTYSTNGIVIPKPYMINRIDSVQIRLDLEKCKLANPDFIIVTIHWGDEYERFENVAQQKLADFILSHGADAIIGSHPHVIQTIKEYSPGDTNIRKIVVYSLGNFVSNQRAQYKDGGIITELNLMKTNEKTILENFSYLPTWVYRDDLPGRNMFYIVPVTK